MVKLCSVHPVIKNFEDFQKIQNHVGSGLTAKEIVKKISKLQETGGHSSLTSKIKGVCKLYALSTIGPKPLGTCL